jgi:hypothetical protein
LQMVQLQDHVSQAARIPPLHLVQARLGYTVAACFTTTDFTAATIFSSFGNT